MLAEQGDDTLTVESATMTPEELSAALAADATGAAEPEADATPAAPEAVPPPAAPEIPPVVAKSEFEQKIDELDPPLPNETKEQRTARMSRGERRILSLIGRAKTSETQLEDARAEIARLKAAPPAAPVAPGTTPAPPKATVPAFSFDAWDAYSDKHPEANYEDWLDARGDAREAWKTEKARVEAEAVARERLEKEIVTELETRASRRTHYIDDFRAEHPDYDAVMVTATDLPLTPAMAEALDDYGPIGPAIVMHLAQHRDEHLAIARLSAVKQITAISDLAKTLTASASPPTTTPAVSQEPSVAAPATTPAPAAAVPARPAMPRAATPSRPLSDAPAPTTVVPGSAQPTRTVYAIGNEGEDADQYIIERQRERKALGLTG